MTGAIDVPVLIVGGGPTGLCASILLSRHGVRSLLVERHAQTAQHPKIRGENVRTMEISGPGVSSPRSARPPSPQNKRATRSGSPRSPDARCGA
jgi:glycine/D-amino acid oxidase-like deaminating enzyme